MSDDSSKGDYEVGYKKPPKHGQIKPGERRSPGRPKGSKGFKATTQAMLNKRVTVRVGGKTKSMSTLEAVGERIREKALKGEDKAIAQILVLAQRVDDAPSVNTADEQRVLSDTDDAILRDFLADHGVTSLEAKETEAPKPAPEKEEGW